MVVLIPENLLFRNVSAQWQEISALFHGSSLGLFSHINAITILAASFLNLQRVAFCRVLYGKGYL